MPKLSAVPAAVLALAFAFALAFKGSYLNCAWIFPPVAAPSWPDWLVAHLDGMFGAGRARQSVKQCLEARVVLGLEHDRFLQALWHELVHNPLANLC